MGRPLPSGWFALNHPKNAPPPEEVCVSANVPEAVSLSFSVFGFSRTAAQYAGFAARVTRPPIAPLPSLPKSCVTVRARSGTMRLLRASQLGSRSKCSGFSAPRPTLPRTATMKSANETCRGFMRLATPDRFQCGDRREREEESPADHQPDPDEPVRANLAREQDQIDREHVEATEPQRVVVDVARPLQQRDGVQVRQRDD